MKKRFALLLLGAALLAGCGLLPQEEEFQQSPVIRAYEATPLPINGRFGATADGVVDLTTCNDMSVKSELKPLSWNVFRFVRE